MFVNQRIRTTLTVGGEVTVFQVIAGEVLVTSGVVVFENSEGGAGKAVHTHFVWDSPGGGLTELL